jgi:DNA-binding FrmR family transcriptional regulator
MSEQNEAHTHVLEDGTIVEHTHGEPQEPHTHVLEDGTIVEHTHEEHQETHTHVLEDGTVIEHTHGEHGHSHSHTHTKAVINRLSRAIGHLESIKRMVENGRDCTEVLIQLSAVKSAINNTGKIILQDHIEHCIVDAVEHDDREALKELERAIDRFMK